MEKIQEVMAAIQNTLCLEGYPHATPSFCFDDGDCVTRWAVAVTLEQVGKVTLPDSSINEATTVADLLHHAFPDADIDEEMTYFVSVGTEAQALEKTPAKESHATSTSSGASSMGVKKTGGSASPRLSQDSSGTALGNESGRESGRLPDGATDTATDMTTNATTGTATNTTTGTETDAATGTETDSATETASGTTTEDGHQLASLEDLLNSGLFN